MTKHNIQNESRAFAPEWLARPALAFSHPDEVIANPELTDPERKAILASWASDALAVEGVPWLRQLENGTTVPVSEVLAALRALDSCSEDEPKPSGSKRATKLAGILRRRPGLSIAVERTP